MSGVCVFQLSRIASRAFVKKESVQLCVNLLPEVPNAYTWLGERIAVRPSISAGHLFTGVVHRLLAQALLKEAGIAPDTPVSTLSARDIQRLANAIGQFTLTVDGTQGFSQAQVTAGGILTDEVVPETMQSRLFDGLYLAGEVLDVDGPCGGYNLHFAFASALTAARAIRAQLGA